VIAIAASAAVRPRHRRHHFIDTEARRLLSGREVLERLDRRTGKQDGAPLSALSFGFDLS
jgi:hypothetical protein